jgi:membrane-bound serine protease (ClpP class)
VDPIAAASALLVAAMLLCFVEVFIPSMGIITMLATVCAATSCFFAFRQGTATGVLFVPANVIGMLLSFGLAFKLLPRSPLAHTRSEVESATYRPVEPLEGLAGRTGVAFTDLRPGGTAMVDERKVDVVAEGGYIEKGTRLKVLRVEGTKVVVTKEAV